MRKPLLIKLNPNDEIVAAVPVRDGLALAVSKLGHLFLIERDRTTQEFRVEKIWYDTAPEPEAKMSDFDAD